MNDLILLWLENNIRILERHSVKITSAFHRDSMGNIHQYALENEKIFIVFLINQDSFTGTWNNYSFAHKDDPLEIKEINAENLDEILAGTLSIVLLMKKE